MRRGKTNSVVRSIDFYNAWLPSMLGLHGDIWRSSQFFFLENIAAFCHRGKAGKPGIATDAGAGQGRTGFGPVGHSTCAKGMRPSAPELAGCTKCSRVASRSRRQRASACARGTSPRAGEAAGRGFVWNSEVAAGRGCQSPSTWARVPDRVLRFRRSGVTGALRAVRHTAGSHGAPQHGATGERRCLWAVACGCGWPTPGYGCKASQAAGARST